MNNCWDCSNFEKSVYMELDGEILYNCWCKVGSEQSEKCNNYIELINKEGMYD